MTNGVTDTQKRRIAQLEFKDILSGVYISEETGYQKPMSEFLIISLRELVKKRKTSIIVGDSLTSDILGGKNAGITTCWFNYRNKENNSDIVPDYEIQSLYELVNLVEE